MLFENIIGIDAGNYRTKIAGLSGITSYSSAICEWFSRDVVDVYGADDMEFEIGSRKGFAGSIAEYENVFGESAIYGDSKAHEDTKIKVLLGLYRYKKEFLLHENSFNIVVGQPISQHIQKEKEHIQNMLKGYHEFIVNGESVSLWIDNIGVAAEGSGSFWSCPISGVVRTIDVGSGTVNMCTIVNKKHVNTSSDTLNFGMQTGRNKKDVSTIARGIIRASTRLMWNKEDKVYVCGGIANEIYRYLKEYHVNAEILNPIHKSYNNITVAEPSFSNAIGFYEIGKGVFT